MIVSSPQAGKKSSGASMGLVAAAMRSGNVMQARLMLQDRLAHNPNDPDALEKLAEIAAGQRSIEEATILLQRAVAIDPSVPRRGMALIAHLRRNAPALALTEIEQLPQAVRDDHEMRGVEATLAGSSWHAPTPANSAVRAMTRERSGDPICGSASPTR